MATRFRRYEIIDHSPSLYLSETTILSPKPFCIPSSFLLENDLFVPTLDLIAPSIFDLISSPFEDLDTITDLVQIKTMPSAARKLQRQLYLQSLCDRVSALELGVDRLVKEKKAKKAPLSDRKYTWTAEIKSPEKDGLDRKYKLTTEIKGGQKKNERSYKWTAEIKGKGDEAPVSRKYTFAAESTGSEKEEKYKPKHQKNDKDHKKVVGPTRIVEITDDETADHRAVVLRQAFAKRLGASEKRRGKKKELSPQDAAAMIQATFRAYLIRRSQSLRALRELAIAKAKLKELRALFNNFSYRRRVSRDAEERQRFSEKIIVLLLTVDAIEAADLMVRAAKRSMVDELEAMLDVIDPQPQGGARSLSMKRRTFDMPDGVIQKELAAGVAQVVRMLDQEPSGEAFEACL